MTGWYKQQRNLSERPWFRDALMVQLYAYLKERAYVTDGRHEGHVIRRGSCPVTRSELSEVTGMSARTLDRVLGRLVSYGEIIVKGNNRFSVITVCDYDSCPVSETLFGSADGITGGTTDGITGGTTDGITGGTTHLLSIEDKKEEDNNILISPYSPYNKERESEDFCLEVKKRYNKTFDGKLAPCIRLTMPTRLMVEECVRRFGRQSIDVVFEQVLAEPFSLGLNKTGFQASFQFIFKPNNFQGYLERAQLRRKKQVGSSMLSPRDGSGPGSSMPTPSVGSQDNEESPEQLQEQRRQQLIGCIRLVSKKPGSYARYMLQAAYDSGELASLGLSWSPGSPMSTPSVGSKETTTTKTIAL